MGGIFAPIFLCMLAVSHFPPSFQFFVGFKSNTPKTRFSRTRFHPSFVCVYTVFDPHVLRYDYPNTPQVSDSSTPQQPLFLTTLTTFSPDPVSATTSLQPPAFFERFFFHPQFMYAHAILIGMNLGMACFQKEARQGHHPFCADDGFPHGGQGHRCLPSPSAHG